MHTSATPAASCPRRCSWLLLLLLLLLLPRFEGTRGAVDVAVLAPLRGAPRPVGAVGTAASRAEIRETGEAGVVRGVVGVAARKPVCDAIILAIGVMNDHLSFYKVH